MTKTEAAAYDYMREYRFAEGPRAIDAYVAGARWALEQMTSEAIVQTILSWQRDAYGNEKSRWEAETRALLAAVRKEIES